MKYRNKLTGAVVDVESELSGAWEAVKTPPVSSEEEMPEEFSAGEEKMLEVPPDEAKPAKPKRRAASKAKAGK